MDKDSEPQEAENKNEVLIHYGSAVKMHKDGSVSGYLVKFSGDEDPDLVGDFFDQETDFDFGDKSEKETTFYYQHGLDPTIKRVPVGRGVMGIDETGVWVKGRVDIKEDDAVRQWGDSQRDLRNDYVKEIQELVKDGALGWSSGTASHLVEVERAGKSHHVKRWPLGLDASLTPTPAEPRTSAVPLKSVTPVPLKRGSKQTINVKLDTSEFRELLSEAVADITAQAERMEKATKASLVEALDEVYMAFWDAFSRGMDMDIWVADVQDDNTVIAHMGDRFYQIPFMKNEDGITFASRDQWVEVEKFSEWRAKSFEAFLERELDEATFKEWKQGSVTASTDSEDAIEDGVEATIEAETKSANDDQSTKETMKEDEKVVEETAENQNDTGAPVWFTDFAEKVDERLKAFESTSTGKTRKAEYQMAPAFVQDVGDTEEAAMGAFIREGRASKIFSGWDNVKVGEENQISIRPTSDQVRAIRSYRNALKASNDTTMNITTAADGGNAVPTGHFGQIIARRDSMALLARLGLRQIPGKGTTVNVPIDNEDDGEFVLTAEQGDAYNTDWDRDSPAIGQKAFTLSMYTKEIPLTLQLLRDEDSQLLPFIENFVGRGLAKTNDNLLLTEVASNGTSFKTFAAEDAIAAGEIEDIVGNDNLSAYIDEGQSVAWVMRNSTLASIRKIRGDARLYENTPTGSGRTLENYPVLINNKAAAIDQSAKSVYFGNWFYVGFREDPEMTVLRNPYKYSGIVLLQYHFGTTFGVLQAEAIGYGVHIDT